MLHIVYRKHDLCFGEGSVRKSSFPAGSITVALFILAQFWPFGEGDRHFCKCVLSSIALLIGSSSTNTAEQLLLAAIIISVSR
ncbi:MAG: hypothetical protein U0Z44_07505 [Kouleothrix sp.]